MDQNPYQPQQPGYSQQNYPPPPYPNYTQQAYPQQGYPQQPYNQPQAPLSPEQQRLQSEAWQTARTMHSGGIHPATIYDILVKKGVEPGAAQRIVQSATLVPASNGKAEGGRDMLIGGLWIVGGIVVTIGTYAMVSDSGGYYLVSYGPIVYGIIRFFKGVSKL